MADVRDHIAQLIEAIRRLHGCDSTHLETVPVTETFEGQTLWQGEVEVFDISGHPKAKRAYAWSQLTGQDDRSTRYVAALELPPVTSPETAVRVAVIADLKAGRK
jgi:hypothetical protein